MNTELYEQIAKILSAARPSGFSGDTPKDTGEQVWERIMNDLAFLLWAKDEDFDLDKFKDDCYS